MHTCCDNLVLVHELTRRLPLPLREVRLSTKSLAVAQPQPSDVRTVDSLQLVFIPHNDERLLVPMTAANWYLRPYAQLYVCVCDDNDRYKKELLPKLRRWVQQQNEASQQWYIVYVMLQSARVDIRLRLQRSVWSNLHHDFREERCIRLKLSPTNMPMLKSVAAAVAAAAAPSGPTVAQSTSASVAAAVAAAAAAASAHNGTDAAANTDGESTIDTNDSLKDDYSDVDDTDYDTDGGISVIDASGTIATTTTTTTTTTIASSLSAPTASSSLTSSTNTVTSSADGAPVHLRASLPKQLPPTPSSGTNVSLAPASVVSSMSAMAALLLGTSKVDQWEMMQAALRDAIAFTFADVVAAYDDEIRRLELQRGAVGWNLGVFCAVKEGLAFTYARAGMLRDALRLYVGCTLNTSAVVCDRVRDQIRRAERPGT
jgi:hypothetical protein